MSRSTTTGRASPPSHSNVRRNQTAPEWSSPVSPSIGSSAPGSLVSDAGASALAPGGYGRSPEEKPARGYVHGRPRAVVDARRGHVGLAVVRQILPRAGEIDARARSRRTEAERIGAGAVRAGTTRAEQEAGASEADERRKGAPHVIFSRERCRLPWRRRRSPLPALPLPRARCAPRPRAASRRSR